MRVVRVRTPAAVVRVRTSHDVLVAVPGCLPPETVLVLARLVLSTAELAQLRRRLEFEHGRRIEPANGFDDPRLLRPPR
jgi:hypothetical protein